MSKPNNETTIYQPNEAMRLDVRLQDDTVWRAQEQISALLGIKRHAITKHLSNIFRDGELGEQSSCTILEHMGYDILTLPISNNFHDRFIAIDNKRLYVIGASLKDLGWKCFAFTELDTVEIPRIKARI